MYEEECEAFGLDAELDDNEGYECVNCGQHIHDHNDKACQEG